MPSLRRNLLAGLTLALLIVLASPALATTYYADINGGPWAVNTTWHTLSNSGPLAPAGSYPGSAAGDTAIMDFQGETVTVTTVVPNAVTLIESNVSMFLNVNAGGVLPLTGNSAVSGGAVLVLNGGTIANGGFLDIQLNSGFTINSGTLSGAGTTQIDFDSTTPALLSISGGTVSAQTITLAGKATYVNGPFNVNDGAQINITVNGKLDIQTAGAVNSNTPATAAINNGGTLNRSIVAGGTNFGVPLNNNSVINVTAGGLVLGASPTHTNGTFNLSGGTAIEAHGTFAGTCNVTGAGALSIVGTPQIANGGTLNVTNILMAGGWLQGPASGSAVANVSGTITFNGGVFQRNLTVNLLTGSVLNVTGVAGAFIHGARVDNNGTINIAPGAGTLGINSGGYIMNNTAINLAGDVTIDSDNVSNPHIDNASGATILKTAGAGTATLNVSVNNDGTLQSNSGNIKFTRSGTHTGTFNICDACIFEFAGGTHVLDGAFMDYGLFAKPVVKLSGATFDIPTVATIRTEFRHSAGTITGAGMLKVQGGGYIWSGGTQSGNGSTQVTGGLLVFNGADGAMTLNGRAMVYAGSLTYAPVAANYLSIDNDARLLNTGFGFTLTTDAPINSDGTGVLDNGSGGTFQKTGGTGKAIIAAQFYLGGAALKVTSGQLALNGGGNMSAATISLPNADNALVVESGNYTLASNTTNPADLGVIRVSGGTLYVPGTLSLTNLELLSGTLSSTDLTVTKKMKWTGGTIVGPGNTTIAATATLSHLAPTLPTFLNDQTLHLNGSTDYEGTGLQLTNNGVIDNNGTFNARDGAILNGIGTNSFNNNGTLKKMAGVTGMRFDVPVKNAGTVSSEVSGQSLIFANGGTNDPSGTLTTTGTAMIDFFGGTFNVNGGTLSGSGQHRVNGGFLMINANIGPPAITLAILNGAVKIASPMTFQVNSLLFNGGAINGPGTLRSFGGSIGNAAPTTLANGATLTLAGSMSYLADLANNLNIGDTSKLNIESGSTLSMPGDSIISGAAPASLTSSGTLVKNGGAGTTTITVPLTSTLGSVGTTSGTLLLTGGGSLFATVNIGSGATLALGGGTFSTGMTTVTGTGTLAVEAGTLDILGPALGVSKLSFSGGTIHTPGGSLTAATATWSGGDFTGFGDMTSNDLVINGAGAKNLQWLLRANNTLSIEGANVGGTGTIENNGTFTRAAADSLTFAPAFKNSGTANFSAGNIAFAGGYSQSAGTTALLGGTFSSASPVALSGGVLKGNGVIGASVAVNNATVSPGLSPGVITINGNYSQSPSGTLNIELGGTAPGSFDQLIVNGAATLAGTVNVSLINGFTLASGEVFDVVTYASHSGVFAPENLPPFPGGTFASTYTPGAYELATAVPSPADVAVTKSGPATAKPSNIISYTIVVKNLGATTSPSVIVNDPTPQGLVFQQNSGDCTTPFPCTLGALAGGAVRTIVATYKVGFVGGSTITNTAMLNVTDADNTNNSASATTSVSCPNIAVSGLQPSGVAGTSGTLTWTATVAQLYEVFLGPKGSGCTTSIGKTLTNSFHYSGLAPNTEYEWRVESSYNGCPVESSSCVAFTTSACDVPQPPLARVVGEATSTKSYAVEWDVVPGAARYEVDEALSPTFTNPLTTIVNQGTSATFTHDAAEPTAYSYRVRAIGNCNDTPGPYSEVIRVVIVPPPSPTDKNPTFHVPVGSQSIIQHKIFIPGDPMQTLFFTATTDREWISVTPADGALPPQGVLLDVTIHPHELPNGTFTATVIVSITGGASGRLTTHGSTTSIPVSVNLVTPVTPVASKGPSQYSLIIPAVGHLNGIDSAWQSDIRVTNAGFKPYKYRLTFTPAAGSARGVKQTDVTVDAGATTALDDIVRNWFGFGSLGDGESGSLEIVPVDEPANASLVTVAASRTYNVTQHGTLGQFIPAVPFPSFIGKAGGGLATILSLQQIAQSNAFRTNVGVVEGSGRSANAIVSIFNAAGTKLVELPQTLAAGQQLQLNVLLAQNNIALNDGRVEVRVSGGDGKVTAYASIVDNGTGDPFLVSGTPLAPGGATKYVLAGAANTNTGFADWRTDMRIFNYGTVPQPATLTLYPLGGGAPKTAEIFAKVGEVLALDNVVKTLFGADNLTGAVHITTPQPASFIVSGRTYNQTSAGTLGQFIPAVTVDQAVGAGGRALQILQVEDSSRYRTNIGLAEVSGKPATVEIQITLPDSKITPVVQIPLAANEYRQLNVIRELALGNVYNGRVSVRVISGEGRVTAYGSLIDELTGDPAFIQGQ